MCAFVVADTTKVRIFKQITTKAVCCISFVMLLLIPQRYEFSSKSQPDIQLDDTYSVVADTTKVRIFKQITTISYDKGFVDELLLIPQRYEFSSKSQRLPKAQSDKLSCCWYHKGTNFQANHNGEYEATTSLSVVADTTKVRIFKQITTVAYSLHLL